MPSSSLFNFENEILSKLTEEELERICEFRGYKQFKNKLKHKLKNSEKVINTVDDAIETILKTAPSIDQLHSKNNRSSRAFAQAFADAQNFPTQVLPAFLGIALITPATIAAVANALGVVLVGSAGIYFAGNYMEQKKNDLHDIQDFTFSLVRLTCASILIERNAKKPQNSAVKNPLDVLSDTHRRFTHYDRKYPGKDNNPPKDYKKKSSWPRAAAWLNTMLPVATATFSLYCFGSGAIGSIFGLATSVALGPIGLTIATGVSLGIGMFFGYQSYRNKCNKELTDKIHNEIDKVADDKLERYSRIKIAESKTEQLESQNNAKDSNENQKPNDHKKSHAKRKKDVHHSANTLTGNPNCWFAKNDELKLASEAPIKNAEQSIPRTRAVTLRG